MPAQENPDFVYLNGAFCRAEDAAISPQDRGFLYGDGAFETVLAMKGLLAQWPFHQARLRETLTALGIHYDAGTLENICTQLLQCNQLGNAVLRIAISRGVGKRGYTPDNNSAPTVYITAQPHNIDAPHAPVALHLSPWRKIPPACLPTHGKLASSLNYVLSSTLEGEGLLLTLEGYVAETSSGNIFWRTGETLYTPSLQTGCISGMVRNMVIQLHTVQEGLYPLETLLRADEIFFTNVGKIVCSVNSIHGHKEFDCFNIAQKIRAELLSVLCV